MSSETQKTSDLLIGFAVPERDARGRAVRIEGVLDEILTAHDYPAPIAHLLAEALVLTGLMGGLLKEDGSQLTLQAQANQGAVRMLVCDYRDGELRGFAEFDEQALATLGPNAPVSKLFEQGYLAITFEPLGGKRYQGVVALDGASLAEACERYFAQSEQIPSLIRTSVEIDSQRRIAGGLLLQHLPRSEEGSVRLAADEDAHDWEHVETLAATISHEELLDPQLPLETIVWRLFHEEKQLLLTQRVMIKRGCRCTPEHFRQVLARFPDDEIAQMRGDSGAIEVDCAFCSRKFEIDI